MASHPPPQTAPARSRSADRPAISARRLVRSRRAVVPLGPGAPRRAARHPALSRRLPVAARRARRRRGAVAQGDRQGPQRADAVLQSRPGGAPAGPASTRRRGASATPSAARRPMSRRGWRWPRIHMDQDRFAAAERELPNSSAIVDQAIGAARTASALKPLQARGPQHAGPRALSPGPHSSRRSRCSTWRWPMPATMPRAAARSWATARWRWAASAITTRRSPRPGRRSSWRRDSAEPQSRAGLRAATSPAGRRGHRADPAGARDRSRLHAGAEDAGAGPGRRRQGRRGRRRCCSGRCATNPLDRDAMLQLSFLHIERSGSPRRSRPLEPYLKAVPDDVRALNNQGLALRGLKRFEEARRALKRASRLATDDPLVLTNLGRVLVDLGRAAEARSLHEHALRGLPGDSRLLGQLRRLPGRAGRADRARETLDAALAANPNNAEALRRAGEASTHERGRRSPGGGRAAHRRRGEGGRPRSGRRHPGRRLQDARRRSRARAAGRGPARVRREPRAGGARRSFPRSRPNIPTSSCI